MASVGFALLRSIFAIGGHLAPVLTGRAAFELFCRTPDPKRVSSRAAGVLEAASALMEEARHHRLTTPAGCIMAYEFRPAAGNRAPTALVIHGWGSRSDHMSAIISRLRGEGLRVVALDLPGHGRSAGRRLNLALALVAVRAVADWFGPFHVIVGHSFGGAVAVNALAGSLANVPPVVADRLVLIAAPSSMPAIFHDFGRFLGLRPHAQLALAARVQDVTGRPLEAFVAAHQLAEMNIDTLVLHAPDDREVAFSEALDFEAAGPHVQVRRMPGRGHRRILADSETAEAVAAHATMPAVRAMAG